MREHLCCFTVPVCQVILLSRSQVSLNAILAGKDRTGVLSAILLALAGIPRDDIAFDYALTRVGIEPARELLVQMLKMWNQEWTAETPGMAEFSSVRGEFILGTLDVMEATYGGVEGYVKGLGFEDEDLVKIRRVFRGE
jgi:protein tyrosine/serine phosphatase